MIANETTLHKRHFTQELTTIGNIFKYKVYNMFFNTIQSYVSSSGLPWKHGVF